MEMTELQAALWLQQIFVWNEKQHKTHSINVKQAQNHQHMKKKNI